MTPALRPMNLGEILDRTFQIYRSRLFVFLAIGLASPMAYVAFLILGAIGSQTTLTTSTKEMFKLADAWMPRYWPVSLVHSLSWPVIAYLTSRELLGEEAPLATALAYCKGRWKSWLAISTTVWVICSLLPSSLERLLRASGLESSVGLNLGKGFPSSVWFLVFELLVWGLDTLFVLGVALSTPAWAVEQLGAVPSVLRGWALAKGSWIRILAAEWIRDALAFILVGSLALIFGVTVGFLQRSYAGGQSIYQARNTFILVATLAVSVATGAILPIALTLFYYDQRIRHEGYDIEQMMAAAGLNPTAIPTAAEGPVAPAVPEEGQA
jgi:hypothetical protein